MHVIGGEPGERSRNILTPLHSGENHEWRIDLAKLFDLRPGEYSLSVSTRLEAQRAGDSFQVAVQRSSIQNNLLNRAV